MLIEFSTTNFRSLRDRQTFSLAKGKGKGLEASNSFDAEAFSKFKLLRSAAIYGPNASGKSNFLLALQVMQKIVLGSAKGLGPGDKLPVKPFLLNRDTRHAPSEFEVTFLVQGVRYQYGFSATENRIHEEWLFAYPKARPQYLFGRKWNSEDNEYDWKLGVNLKGEKQVWQKSTRENALYLSTAVQLNCEQLQPIFDWFKKSLRMAGIAGWSPGFSASLCDTGEKDRVMDFLRSADLNIEDIKIEEKLFDVSNLPESMPKSLKDAIADDLKDKQILDIKTIHKDQDGEDVQFELEDESDGTQKMFAFAGPWIDSLTNGHVLFIDELHDHLHPRLVQFLVSLFHSNDSNPNSAQLIFTTHETSILNQEEFRRDQIWFCEKDKDHASTIFPLTDFSPRKDRENLELAYLSGRYGALPYVRKLERAVNGHG